MQCVCRPNHSFVATCGAHFRVFNVSTTVFLRTNSSLSFYHYISVSFLYYFHGWNCWMTGFEVHRELYLPLTFHLRGFSTGRYVIHLLSWSSWFAFGLLWEQSVRAFLNLIFTHDESRDREESNIKKFSHNDSKSHLFISEQGRLNAVTSIQADSRHSVVTPGVDFWGHS
jgi:hypothetical protein